MADDPPELIVAASQSDADLAKQQALDELRWPTREMAANLLRVMRGAGRPHELPQQVINLSDTILEAAERSNAWGIWSTIQEVLCEALPDRDRTEIGDSYETIVHGALQTAASRLVMQRAQEVRGEDEMRAGVRQLDEVRKERRLRREAEAKAAAAIRRSDRSANKAPKHRTVKTIRTPAPRLASKPSAPPADEDIDPSAWKSTADYMRLRREQLKKQMNAEDAS